MSRLTHWCLSPRNRGLKEQIIKSIKMTEHTERALFILRAPDEHNPDFLLLNTAWFLLYWWPKMIVPWLASNTQTEWWKCTKISCFKVIGSISLFIPSNWNKEEKKQKVKWGQPELWTLKARGFIFDLEYCRQLEKWWGAVGGWGSGRELISKNITCSVKGCRQCPQNRCEWEYE